MPQSNPSESSSKPLLLSSLQALWLGSYRYTFRAQRSPPPPVGVLLQQRQLRLGGWQRDRPVYLMVSSWCNQKVRGVPWRQRVVRSFAATPQQLVGPGAMPHAKQKSEAFRGGRTLAVPALMDLKNIDSRFLVSPIEIPVCSPPV